MNNELINKIRNAEGFTDNYTEPQRIMKTANKNDICEFADVLSYNAKLFECKYNPRCDYQLQMGTKRKYCGRELNK